MREVCGVVFEIFKLIIFLHLFSNFSTAQLVEHSTGMLKVPGMNPILGEFFHLLDYLKRTTSTRAIPWSLADGRRQKLMNI